MTTAAPARPSPASAAFSGVLHTALEVAVETVSRKVDDWTDKLDSIGGDGDGPLGMDGDDLEDLVDEATPDDLGAKGQAAVGAATAGVQGKNPVWGAVKGAWSGGGTKVKVAIVAAVVALILLLLLSPVLLLVFLIVGLIIYAVIKAKQD